MSIRVYGEGSMPSDVLVLGDMPGPEEARSRRPFIGKAGRELRRHFNGYTIPRTPEDVYFSNLSKQPMPDVKSMVFDDDDERDLWAEIGAVRPRYILTCGARVTQYFLGDAMTLEMVHGIPHKMTEQRSGQWIEAADDFMDSVPLVFPTYNPAAALHVPRLQSTFAYDLRRFGLWLRGKLPAAPVDERPGQYVLTDDKIVQRRPVIAVDTEGWMHRAWGLSYSANPYQGVVVRKDAPVIAELRREWAMLKRQIVLHNSLHDIGVLRVLGLDLEEMGVTVDDTMVMAYLLGLEPQGLKPLAYRHAGMEHDDYSDIVAEPNERIAFEWLCALHDRLPDTPPKLTKTAIKKGAVQIVLTDAEVPLAKAKKLIAKQLSSDSDRSIRKRWEDGRSREILTDETNFIDEFEADPPEATLDEVPIDVAVNYTGRDADATIRVFPYLSKQIDAFDLRDVYETDMAVIPMIERMQTVGLGVDVDHFRSLSVMMGVEQQMNADALRAMIGREINPNSGDQVAELLFDELKLHEKVPNVRFPKTKSGERLSTNDKILEALEDMHPVVPLIMDGREIKKLKGTYADPMPKLLGRDGRLHPTYRITRTDTGRLSATNPNVLAFPKHSKRGKLLRDGFIAAPGRELGEWDYDQIEMRVFAHDSQDPTLIAEFFTGLDKHAQTAALMYNRDVQEILKEYKGGFGEGEHERFTAKALNFGVLMGITEYGLVAQFHKAGQLDWKTFDEDVVKYPKQTRRMLENWFAQYPRAADYIQEKHAEARQHGFVRDMWGRLRWLEGIHAADDYIRAEAERQAQATPTQSGAQGIVKRGMKAVWPVLKELRKQGMWVECLLQVHDALVLEYDEGCRADVDAAVMAAMHTTVELSVPITAKAKFGYRLGAL